MVYLAFFFLVEHLGPVEDDILIGGEALEQGIDPRHRELSEACKRHSLSSIQIETKRDSRIQGNG